MIEFSPEHLNRNIIIHLLTSAETVDEIHYILSNSGYDTIPDAIQFLQKLFDKWVLGYYDEPIDELTYFNILSVILAMNVEEK